MFGRVWWEDLQHDKGREDSEVDWYWQPVVDQLEVVFVLERVCSGLKEAWRAVLPSCNECRERG